MFILQRALLVCLSSIVVISCHESVDAPTVSCDLTGEHSDDYSRILKYNDAGFISSIEYDILDDGVHLKATTQIEYTGSNKIAKIISGDNNYSTFEHQPDGTIVETSYSRFLPTESFGQSQTTYSFDNKGFLIKKLHSTPDSYDRFEYDSKGNLLKVYTTDAGVAGEHVSEEYLTYDNKRNGASKVFFTDILVTGSTNNTIVDFIILTRYSPEKSYSKNNPLHVKLYEISGVVINEDINYSYDYNEFGYPVNVGSGYEMTYDCK